MLRLRFLLRSLFAIGLLFGFMASGSATTGPAAPAIPARVFEAAHFGALGDGSTDDTAALQAAIDAAASAGGGVVVVPRGVFVSGPLKLKSKIEVRLTSGATLQLLPMERYPKGTGPRPASFLSAENAADLRLTGEGTIDGLGAAWWDVIHADKKAGRPLLGRPQLVAFNRCQRIEISGLTFLNPPNTHVSFRLCDDVTFRNLTLRAPDESPNTDGLNFSGRNYLIAHCNISTGDDNVAINATGDNSRGPVTENIEITHCKIGFGHGISIGSHTSGNVQHVRVDHCTFDGTTAAIRLKTARGRGGDNRNLVYSNITINGAKHPIFISSYYPKEPKSPELDAAQPSGPKTPRWSDIRIENVTATNCTNSIVIWGVPEQPIDGVRIENVRLQSERGFVIHHAKRVEFVDVSLTHTKGEPLQSYQAELLGQPALIR